MHRFDSESSEVLMHALGTPLNVGDDHARRLCHRHALGRARPAVQAYIVTKLQASSIASMLSIPHAGSRRCPSPSSPVDALLAIVSFEARVVVWRRRSRQESANPAHVQGCAGAAFELPPANGAR